MKKKETPRLCDLPDVLTVPQFCAVMQISEPSFWVMKRHNALPVKPLKLKARRVLFSNASVQAFLSGNQKAS